MPVLSDQEFQDLIQRVRAGEQDAAANLVQHFEPQIRREVRLRLTQPQMRRTLDSVDICQSVFGKFFVKASLGELEFDRPQQLLRLLCQMARNKVIDCHRRAQVRQPSDGQAIVALEGDSPDRKPETPSLHLSQQELLTKMDSLLSPLERQIAELRKNGTSWNDIAEEIGDSPEALRKVLSRACDRVITELEMVE